MTTTSRKAKGLSTGDDEVVAAFSVFLETITDEWILENFSLGIIVKNYNQLVAQARAGKKNKNGKAKAGNTQNGAGQLDRQMQAIADDIAKADEYYYHQQQGESGG